MSAVIEQFEPTKLAKDRATDGAVHDTVHKMARDEARHGKVFEGLLNGTSRRKEKPGFRVVCRDTRKNFSFFVSRNASHLQK